MILVFARGTAAAPVKPAASGTVPAWVNIQSALANAIGLTSVGFIATASNHTTGVFTSATHICVLVLRPDGGKTLDYGTSSTGNGNNTQTIIYPALTLTKTDGTSWGVRCGTRITADTEVATNVPSSWTNRIAQPSPTALIAVHTRAGLVANPTADSIATTGTNAAYRAHTIEIEEITPATPINSSDTDTDTVESQTVEASIQASDIGVAELESVTASASVADSDTDGVIAEAEELTVNVVSSDANGTIVESQSVVQESLDQAKAGSDSGTATESATVVARVASADVNGSTVEAANTAVPISLVILGVGTETTTLVVLGQRHRMLD